MLHNLPRRLFTRKLVPVVWPSARRTVVTSRLPLASTSSQNERATRSAILPGLALLGSAVAILAASTPNSASTTTKNDASMKASPVDIHMDNEDDETTDVINWSGTHQVTVSNSNYWEPETQQQVEQIVQECHRQGQTVRPLGASLSPNGIALNADGMMAMSNLDRILEIDTKHRTVTVEAGVPVSRVVEALREHRLTLPNLASIAEQQMGGFIQVGAHGTGKTVAPVDHYVTKLKIVTPGQGTLTLTRESHGRLFDLGRVGLGCLGVVVEITMQCIPAHDLLEHTFVLTRKQAIQQKDDLLKKHKHMRFMWIPYTDAVVVVTNDPSEQVSKDVPRNQLAPGSLEERNQPLTDLLKHLCQEHHTDYSEEDVKGMGFGEIRGKRTTYAKCFVLSLLLTLLV